MAPLAHRDVCLMRHIRMNLLLLLLYYSVKPDLPMCAKEHPI